MVNSERILIVGGGIAGLTVATALHRKGFRAELVERSASWHAAGAGILLHANGMRVLRTLVMETVPPGYTGLMIWRSLVPIRPRGVTNFKLMLGDGCFFGIMPMGDGHTNVFGGVGMPRTHDPVQGRLERFRKRFAGFGWQVQDCLAAITNDEQIYCGPIEWVKIDNWRRGRIVLIGDAAHTGPPTMAEGGCMAREDAYVLAEVLNCAETVEGALESYATRRVPRANWVQQQSRVVVESLLMIPALRNPAFRERGNQGMHDRFRPLISEP